VELCLYSPYAFMAWTERILTLHIKKAAKSSICCNTHIHVKLHRDRRNNETEAKQLNLTQKYVLEEHNISFLTTSYSSLAYLIPIFFVTYFLNTWNWQYFLQIRDCLTTTQNCKQNNCCINSKVCKVQVNMV